MNQLNKSSATSMNNYFHIAWQSAVAAALCLGLPAGLMFWVLVITRSVPSVFGDALLTLLQDYWLPNIIASLFGALGWGLALSRISGYRPWWWIAVATGVGVLLGSMPIGLLSRLGQSRLAGLPLHHRFTLILCSGVFCVAVSIGLSLGILLQKSKASLVLALSGGITTIALAMGASIILESLGIRVGGGNLGMPKVTAVATMAASLGGGAVLGVMFSRYVRAGQPKH